jgi:hypothetical protein
MALIVAMGPPKKGNKMKKKEEVMLEDESDIASDMDLEEEYDDLEDEDMEGLDGEEDDEDMLFGDMDESEDADLEMLVEDVMSAFEAKDSKQLMNALKDFIRSVMDKE